jgi:hypothetical protein
MHLVAAHVARQHPFPAPSVDLVEAATISDALAWGYAGAVPNPAVWAHSNGPFGKFRTSTLIKRAVEAAADLTTDERLNPAHVPVPQATVDPRLPTRQFSEEVWLNLTAPLKHQLRSTAVTSMDGSEAISSVNALRWDGKGWWSAGLDGQGLLDALVHLGFHPNSHVLGLVGGGGAARSTAVAWTEAGGRWVQLPSRRPLLEGPWEAGRTTDSPDITAVFDGDAELPDGVLIMAQYSDMEGTVDERIDALLAAPYDGRWMLAAQHLACWRSLWAPELSEALPSLGALLHQLVVAENVLSVYA